MALVQAKSNSQLEDEERAALATSNAAEVKGATSEQFTSSLAGYLRTKWESARRAKLSTIEPQLLKNLRQTKGMYDPKKLAAIQSMGAGSTVNLNQTGVKCFSAMAWISDIIFSPNGRCWDITRTPVPDIDSELLARIDQRFSRTALSSVMGNNPGADVGAVVQDINAQLPSKQPEMTDEIKKIAREIADQKAQECSREIDDKLTEGGWYQALQAAINDLVYLGTGFIKGPMMRYRDQRAVEVNPTTGRKEIVTKKTAVYEYECRSPFNIYPEPDALNVQDGYLFDHVSYRADDLVACRGLDGFNTEAINSVLQKYITGGLREWTGIESERAQLEGRDTQAVYQSDKIEGLEYYGSVPGTTLLEWGMTSKEIPDPVAHYNIRAAMIGSDIIQAVLNPDPLGRKMFAKASYEEINNSYWGRSLAEKVEAGTGVCNAAARALVNNLGMGSGPQVEINIDRLHGGDRGDTRLIPWKRWITHNKQQATGNAINFFQPNMHAQEIMSVLKDFSNIVDESGGIPGYSHGNPQVGGAGNTASGLSMLITQSSRAIKSVIRNIDNNLIVPSIQYMYDELLSDENSKYIDVVGDIKLVAKGTSALIEKEQRAVRMLELIGASENPYAAQTIGPRGFQYLWRDVAKSYDMDPDNVVTGEANVNQAPPGVSPEASAVANAGQSSPGGTMASPVNLDAAGNTPSGADSQLITGQGGHPSI